MLKIKYATAGTIAGIEKLINSFYCSTSYRVDPDTLQISGKNGILNNGVKVEFKKNRYIFGEY